MKTNNSYTNKNVLSAAQQHAPSFDTPPPYQPPESGWYSPPPPAYAAAASGYYGWMPPTNVFPEQPPGTT